MLLRRLAISALFIGALFVSGCTSYLTETNPPQAWTQGRFEDARANDKQRLLGEDHSTSSVGDYFTYLPRKFWECVEWTWNFSTGNLPIKYAKLLFDANPDSRREAIYTLSAEGFGRREPYTKYYAHMATDDADPTVRAAAIRALNRSRATAFTDVYIERLSDPKENEWVRLEAVKALANIPSDKAAPGLSKLLADDQQSRDIRIAAADALRAYHQSDVAQSLIRVLSDRDFGVAWQARTSLNLMTGKDHKYDAAAWLDYLTKTEKPFAN